MVDPEYRVDIRLTRFFSRSSFAHLAKTTKTSYTTDYRVFFDFLWQRGKSWDEATADDLLDFEDWRRRSPRNTARISGAKWNRELAALRRLYEWAARQGHVTASPVAVRTVRDRHGDLVEVAQAWATDVRSSNVKWLTPRAYRLWRDVGLRGYDRRRPAGRLVAGPARRPQRRVRGPAVLQRAAAHRGRVAADRRAAGAGRHPAVLRRAARRRGRQGQAAPHFLYRGGRAARHRGVLRHDPAGGDPPGAGRRAIRRSGRGLAGHEGDRAGPAGAALD